MSLTKRVPLHRWVQWISNSVAQCRLLQTLEGVESVPMVTRTEIKSLLESKKYPYKLGHSSYIMQCPFCQRKGESEVGIDWSMFVNYNTGSVVCKPCALKGTWSDFLGWAHRGKSLPQSNVDTPLPVPQADTVVVDGKSELELSTEHAQKVWSRTRKWEESPIEITSEIQDVFGIKKLQNLSLEKYQVHTATSVFSTPSGSESDLPCVAFPWYQNGRLVRVKLDTVTPVGKRQITLEPKDGCWGLFGWSVVQSYHKEIVITAGEFDAVAVHQGTGLPAVALPSGTTTLPPEVLPQLEQFDKVYLWLGNSVQARQASTHFAKKLNLKRCRMVRSLEKGGPMLSALEALSKGVDMAAAIKAAKPFEHKQIVSFNQIRSDVYGELSNKDIVSGVKWKRFPQLASILKGHRPGELTVFTGPTGRGKTTLIGEMSLDLCSQGVPTLWGSFEIKNVRLAKTLLKQYSGLNLEHHLQQYNYWADKFQQLPLYFMGFYGSADISTVIETMAHAVYAHDIQHIIVDNLQFMLGATNVLDRYSAQNQAIGELRKFASLENVHVTVVIHPRKEDDNNELTTASIFGTAKASQEADNVIILQCPRGRDKYMQVTKNRYDGDLGKVPLMWDKDTCTMSGHFSETAAAQSIETQDRVIKGRNSIPSSKTFQHLTGPSTTDNQTNTLIGKTSQMFQYPSSKKIANQVSLVSSHSNGPLGSTPINGPLVSEPVKGPLGSEPVKGPLGSRPVNGRLGLSFNGYPLSEQASKSQANTSETKRSSPASGRQGGDIKYDEKSHLG